MDRRRFLEMLVGGALGAAVTSTLDVDRLLWVPGARRIFLPAKPALALHEWLVVEEVAAIQRRLNFYRSLEADLLQMTPQAPFRVGDIITIAMPRPFSARVVAP
ncbi:hypothetical protein LLG88_13405 [bacterium]|nr:hypothetical protein [bacterium]